MDEILKRIHRPEQNGLNCTSINHEEVLLNDKIDSNENVFQTS